MNFKRKQRIKDKPAKHYKEWYDESKQYRVSWRNKVFDVEVQPGFYACVRCSNSDGSVYWGFVGRRGLYRSLTTAMDACDRNRQIWDKFLAIEGKAKVRQLKELKEHAIFGSGKSSYSMMAELPVWMVTQAPVHLMEILCGKNQTDPTEASKCPDAPRSCVEDKSNKDGPAPSVEEPEPGKATTKTIRKSAKTPAKRAKAPAKGRGKKSAKRTAKRSPCGKKKSKRTTVSSKSGKKRSTNSVKKKSGPSKD